MEWVGLTLNAADLAGLTTTTYQVDHRQPLVLSQDDVRQLAAANKTPPFDFEALALRLRQDKSAT